MINYTFDYIIKINSENQNRFYQDSVQNDHTNEPEINQSINQSYIIHINMWVVIIIMSFTSKNQ